MAYLTKGSGVIDGQKIDARTLIRSEGLEFVAGEDTQMILVYESEHQDTRE